MYAVDLGPDGISAVARVPGAFVEALEPVAGAGLVDEDFDGISFRHSVVILSITVTSTKMPAYVG